MQRGQLRARDDDALGIGSRRGGQAGFEATEGSGGMVVEMWGRMVTTVVAHLLQRQRRRRRVRRVLDEDDEEWGRGMRLTESRVRTKLSTSIDKVAPSLGFSSATFLGRAMAMEGVLLRLGLMIWGGGSLKGL